MRGEQTRQPPLKESGYLAQVAKVMAPLLAHALTMGRAESDVLIEDSLKLLRAIITSSQQLSPEYKVTLNLSPEINRSFSCYFPAVNQSARSGQDRNHHKVETKVG